MLDSLHRNTRYWSISHSDFRDGFKSPQDFSTMKLEQKKITEFTMWQCKVPVNATYRSYLLLCVCNRWFADFGETLTNQVQETAGNGWALIVRADKSLFFGLPSISHSDFSDGFKCPRGFSIRAETEENNKIHYIVIRGTGQYHIVILVTALSVRKTSR